MPASKRRSTRSRKNNQPEQPLPDHADGPAAALAQAIPPDWRAVLGEQTEQPSFRKLASFLEAERAQHQVFPPEDDVFNALRYTPFDQVRVVLLGQDPYHDDGQAHGLAFSVRPGVTPPPSLRNIFRELHDDLGCRVPDNGCLIPWARQGVLLLNAVLTVRAHEPGSHRNHGWEAFTDAAIKALGHRDRPVVFLLWGGQAQKKIPLIDSDRDVVLTSAHPSPLSVKKFLGSRPFSRANEALAGLGLPPIDWQIPDLGRLPKPARQ